MAKKTKAERQEIHARRMAYLNERLVKTLESTSKQLIWIFSINGILWIWCSYILAFMGRDTIAEALSSNVCTVIIGQLGFYLISKTVENVFRYNDIFQKRRLNLTASEVATLNNTTANTGCQTPFENPLSSTDMVYTNNEEVNNNEQPELCTDVDPNALD